MSYNELTRRCFERADCAGSAHGPGWFRGTAGSPAAGTWVQFDVQVDAACGDTLRAARFLAFGCPHVIAVAQWLAERAPGFKLVPELPVDVLPEDVQALRRRFEVPAQKTGRLLIIEDAWRAALTGAILARAGIETPGA